MDSNGYNESVFDTEAGRCYFCNKIGDTVRHEVYYGNPNRRKAKKLGYWVNLCPACHRVTHRFANDGIDKYLKQKGQIIWEAGSDRDEFIKEWGRSYL